MENLKNGSVCLVCSSNTDNINNDSNSSTSGSEVISNFLRFVTRYLSYSHSSFNNYKYHQFLTTAKSPKLSSCIKCCDICIEQLKIFLEVYEGFELIQLELLNILDRLSTMMSNSCSGNKSKQISDLQVAFTNLVEEKRTQHFPVVKINKLETSNIKSESINLPEDESESNLNVNHLKLEPSPFEDDHTDLEDFNLDYKFETSSQNNLSELLENEIESKPIISKIAIIKIENYHDDEQKVPSSKDLSPNYQKSKRKLFPNIMKRRVQDKYTCVFCSESHRNRCKLFRHMRRHIEERAHQCKKCLQEYSDRHGLKGHIIRDHYRGNRPEPVKDKPCPICGQLFRTNLYVKSHISYIHTKVKNVKCEHENCSKAFVRRADLIKHQKIHTDLKPFECSICNKMYKRRCEVAKHKLLKHGVETGKFIRAECSVCGKVFPEIRKLRIHRARVHPDLFRDDRKSLIKFKCPHAQCDKRFLSKYDVKQHIRRKHDRTNPLNI